MATPTTGAEPVLPKPLFTLDDRPERDYIVVDGQHYEVLLPEELTLVQHQRLMRVCPRYDALMALDRALTDDEATELTGLVARIVEIVLQAPADIRARLRESEQLAIVLAFTGLSRRLLQPSTRAETTVQQMRALAEPAARPAAPSIGAKKSRASRGSTRAPRRTRG